MKLFFLPYAGASCMCYHAWEKRLSSDFDVFLIELAGKGRRMGEPFYANLPEAVEDVYHLIISETLEEEFMIFGHSMGALIAYEVCRLIQKRHKRLPLHVFLSGQSAPCENRHLKIDFEASDHIFLKQVEKLGGLSEDFYREEIQNLFLPILRADIKILEEHSFEENQFKVPCNASLLYGKTDNIASLSEVKDWIDFFEGTVDQRGFTGEHFFLKENVQEIIALILQKKEIYESFVR